MRIWPAAALAWLMALGGGTSIPAEASCAGVLPGSATTPPAPALGFVGTVTATSDQDRTATVHVDEVWMGPHIPGVVIMRGSPDVGAVATSVDRRYQNGHKYLFIPVSASGPPYEDNSCSATREFTSTVAAGRPSSVIQYPPAPPGPPVMTLAAVFLAALGAAVYAFLRLRDRREGPRGL